MRKARAKKRILLPDPKYSDVLVTRIVNNMMLDGKKSVAYGIFYGMCELVEEKMRKNGEEVSGLEMVKKALNNVMPTVEVRSRRVGGATFQVPTEVRPDRRIAVGIKWLISYAKNRNEKTMVERLAGEVIAACKGEGAAVKKKEDTHRMAEANRAFSHFRF
jgi:small subunit ribosomal protein S7